MLTSMQFHRRADMTVITEGDNINLFPFGVPILDANRNPYVSDSRHSGNYLLSSFYSGPAYLPTYNVLAATLLIYLFQLYWSYFNPDVQQQIQGPFFAVPVNDFTSATGELAISFANQYLIPIPTA